MIRKDIAKMTVAAGAAAMSPAKAIGGMDAAAVEAALATLKTYDWGADRNVLNPIDQAINAAHGDAAARQAIEKSLVDLLTGGISRSAQDYVCRKLRVIGTAQSVGALAALLSDEGTSHIARYALERIGDERAISAMRGALAKVSNKLKPGIIGSLGKCRDIGSIKAISGYLGDSDVDIAKAAADGLAMIGTVAAARELSGFAKSAPASMKAPVADACLICAEKLLADGQKTEAVALYKALSGDDQPRQVKVAATKGILTAAAGK